MNVSASKPRGYLTETIIRELSLRLAQGTYLPGQKLPSEQALCKEFDVSRSVIREAVASLRLGGRLVARHGVGVFVAENDGRQLGFSPVPADDEVRAAAQILELRIGIETEAVMLAARRRTPAALAAVTAAFDHCNTVAGQDPETEAQADFAFHMAIARATQNPQFIQLLNTLGPEIIFDLTLKQRQLNAQQRKTRQRKMNREHGAILAAITMGNANAARTALRKHLEESLSRYRRLLENS